MSSIFFEKDQTLCWDCANATRNGCSWAKSGKPVEGWTARKTSGKWYSSYLVTACPLFKRDAENAGKIKYRSHLEFIPLKETEDHEDRDFGKPIPNVPVCRVDKSNGHISMGVCTDRLDFQANGRPRDVDREVLPLGYGIVERAVMDWKALEYGRRESTMVDGIVISREETVRFFFSKWFHDLVEPLSYTPKQIRAALRIPENTLEIIDAMKGVTDCKTKMC